MPPADAHCPYDPLDPWNTCRPTSTCEVFGPFVSQNWRLVHALLAAYHRLTLPEKEAWHAHPANRPDGYPPRSSGG